LELVVSGVSNSTRVKDLQHGVVLDLGLSEGGTVSGDEDEFGYGSAWIFLIRESELTFAVSQLLQSLLVSESELEN